MALGKKIILIIGMVSSFLLAEQFVVKKKKTVSSSKLKEQCCEQYARIMHEIPDLLHALADLQSKAITVIADYCDGDKSSVFMQSSQEKLAEHTKTLSEVEELIVQIKQQLVERVSKL